MRLAVVLVLAALGAGALVVHRTAGACGMLLDPPVQRPEAVAKFADGLLQAGFPNSAAAEITGRDDLQPYADGLLRILADAVVRSEGRALAQHHDVDWAVTTLELLAKQEGSARGGADPRTLTALGLGLSQIEARRQEGHALLEKLAAEDLLTNAHAYAKLAHLHAEAGRHRDAAAARERCRLMLEHPDEVCGRSEKQDAS